MISVYDRMPRHCHRSIPTAASIASDDAPLIGERAATRVRIAAEGGDERAGVKRAVIRSSASLANWIGRREL
jgi:hypothetical protein